MHPYSINCPYIPVALIEKLGEMIPSQIANDIVGVQPMPDYAAELFKWRYKYRIVIRRRGKKYVIRSHKTLKNI